MSVVFDSQQRKARKEHQCAYCTKSIDPGEVYATWAYRDGGYMGRVTAHPFCADLYAKHTTSFDDAIYVAVFQEILFEWQTEVEETLGLPHGTVSGCTGCWSCKSH